MLCGFRHLLYQKTEKKGNVNEKRLLDQCFLLDVVYTLCYI